MKSVMSHQTGFILMQSMSFKMAAIALRVCVGRFINYKLK